MTETPETTVRPATAADADAIAAIYNEAVVGVVAGLGTPGRCSWRCGDIDNGGGSTHSSALAMARQYSAAAAYWAKMVCKPLGIDRRRRDDHFQFTPFGN